MRSRLYVGTVMHARLAPVEHAFHYPAFVFALDVDELAGLDRKLRLFGANRGSLFSLHEADYLGDRNGDLRGKLERRIATAGGAFDLDRIVLVTTPRVLGHVFNPVSFYYCYDADEQLAGVVAEVNNTFGEGHVYVLPSAEARFDDDDNARWRAAKEFHVSPFNDLGGDYAFRLAPLGRRLDVRIDIRREGGCAFRSRLSGSARPLSDAGLLRLAATYPLTAALTLPRILWQAYKLHYRRGLPVFEKPAPSSAGTFEATRPAYIHEFFAPHSRAATTEGKEMRETHGSH